MTRVLLVEDDVWLADLGRSVLVKAGYDVVVGHNAPEAIDLVDSFHPEVMVVDVLLAGSTAFALLHELQSYRDTHEIPVILCTNLAEQFSKAQLADYGVARVIDKSVMHPSDIVTAIRAVTT